ncbi:MAG TPA: hypothetical protein VEY51_10760 [Chondromyces sp.]|nr:hypothetical protein [Chondromyces sp.]
MFDFIAESVTELTFYSYYMGLALHFLLVVTIKWIQTRSYSHSSIALSPYFVVNGREINLILQKVSKGFCLLNWLCRTIRRKESSDDNGDHLLLSRYKLYFH